MSYFGSVWLKDISGNTIHTTEDADGHKHIGTAIIQEIITSSNNFTTDNLGTGATYTGTADTTFGINGIRIKK